MHLDLHISQHYFVVEGETTNKRWGIVRTCISSKFILHVSVNLYLQIRDTRRKESPFGRDV